MIALAIDILKQPPQPENPESHKIRTWAIQVVNRYGLVPIPEDTAKVLTESQPLVAPQPQWIFNAGMGIDPGGSPHAYHPNSQGSLDYLANAGSPGHWWGILTDNQLPTGHPVVQGPNDPAPGFYISPTQLGDPDKAINDPKRYVDSETIPYIALPTGKTACVLGDIVACYNRTNGKIAFAIYADLVPANRDPEGSVALAKSLGIPSSARNGGVAANITYAAFPKSGNGRPLSVDDIHKIGKLSLDGIGGEDGLKSNAP
jgi:hypothetical protein